MKYNINKIKDGYFRINKFYLNIRIIPKVCNMITTIANTTIMKITILNALQHFLIFDVLLC